MPPTEYVSVTENPPSPTLYRLSCGASGKEWHFRSYPAHLPDELLNLGVYGLTDVCAEALAHAATVRPDRVARYGECLSLECLNP